MNVSFHLVFIIKNIYLEGFVPFFEYSSVNIWHPIRKIVRIDSEKRSDVKKNRERNCLRVRRLPISDVSRICRLRKLPVEKILFAKSRGKSAFRRDRGPFSHSAYTSTDFPLLYSAKSLFPRLKPDSFMTILEHSFLIALECVYISFMTHFSYRSYMYEHVHNSCNEFKAYCGLLSR